MHTRPVRLIGLGMAVLAAAALATTVSRAAAPPNVALRGFVDLHTHPMVHLAFGGKLVHGGVDVGSLLPIDDQCHHWVRATSMEHALGQDAGTHGGWGVDNPCGDAIRQQVVHTLQKQLHAAVTPDRARGAGDFPDWPRWDDLTHQKMWVDWIRRAHDGGLRVMVALATNSRTLGDAVSGPGDGPTDDKASADLQITEIKAFVARHPDFLEVAYGPDDLAHIVQEGKLAVVLGVEIDNIGNFNRVADLNAAKVEAELDRLVAEGVRYVFPIHVLDNPFGGTAVFEGTFNMANVRETGRYWDVECADPQDGIGYHYTPGGFDLALGVVKAAKLGLDPFSLPPIPPVCDGLGHRNARGLTPLGEQAIKAMMRRGLLIDVDHMSQKSTNRALELAEAVPGGYPLNSGHSGLREAKGNERSATREQYRRIAALHGMAGVGSEATDSYTWLRHYADVVGLMGMGAVGLGTDINGLVRCPKPRPGSHVVYDASFPMSRTGTRAWDYNVDGVAHYGLLADWIRDMRTAPDGPALVDDSLMHGADYFWQTWQKAWEQRQQVR